ncbi:hypothetical protein GCM10028807_34210 [Spirosoma daeguense]
MAVAKSPICIQRIYYLNAKDIKINKCLPTAIQPMKQKGSMAGIVFRVKVDSVESYGFAQQPD